MVGLFRVIEIPEGTDGVSVVFSKVSLLLGEGSIKEFFSPGENRSESEEKRRKKGRERTEDYICWKGEKSYKESPSPGHQGVEHEHLC
jgi:hypothetical protein